MSVSLLADFRDLVGSAWEPSREVSEALDALLSSLNNTPPLTQEQRRSNFYTLLNSKFRLNSDGVSAVLDYAAPRGMLFNYHDKLRLTAFFDRADRAGYEEWLMQLRPSSGVRGEFAALRAELQKLFKPIAPDESLRALNDEVRDPGKYDSVLEALFRGYVYMSFDEATVHKHFNEDCMNQYYHRFYDHLTHFYPAAIHRDRSLFLLTVDPKFLQRAGSYEAARDSLFTCLRDSYSELTNHCYLAVLIKQLPGAGADLQWQLYSDVVLYAEKHREGVLQKGYFRPAQIQEATAAHIPDLNLRKARFETANEGYFYRDCVVLQAPEGDAYDILLLFQKNERDETVIPCPSCRSNDVQGNSYPVLGVRSWECRNVFCPERSKYNRGKRYSLLALIKQEAIEQDENIIPVSSLRQWRLDVVVTRDHSEVLDMLLRHYTLSGDTAVLVNHEPAQSMWAGRHLEYRELAVTEESRIADEFYDSAFFHRFRIRPQVETPISNYQNISTLPRAEVYCGDAYSVLRSLPSDSIDGAVTSPPYYNAREYAQWSNIYCYLYDMYNIARQVYRVLKPGSLFVFNIFDYYDNENTIVFSAMGQKRMILGAYIIHLFRSLGFVLGGNVVWNKGEIEGTRNFNQGNFSPYYQAPFNCWEHVFIFTKGEVSRTPLKSRILNAKPVIKMVRGTNILGHSAPYPPEIPSLLLDILPPGSTVLDPFSGSMTTGRVAHARGYTSVSIDHSREYCELGLNKLREEIRSRASQVALL